VLKPQPVVRLNTDGEFGQATGWLWRDGGHPCSVSGKPVYVWRPMARFKTPYAVGDRLFPAMPIPSLNRNYCADLFGRIWSRAKDGETWDRLKGAPTSKGYLSITPAHEGRYRTRLVHRLVAEAYYGFQPRGLRQVRHLNGDQPDNSPENLDWGTQEDNWSDRYAHGRGSGEHHHAAKLTSADAEAIRSSSASQRDLAEQFGVTQSAIWAVRAGRVWQANPQANPPNCPRWASRITLEVTGVKVERLQDIKGADIIAEGSRCQGCFDTGRSACMDGGCFAARDAFRALWNSINGPGAWEANPWVAAYTFRVISTGGQADAI